MHEVHSNSGKFSWRGYNVQLSCEHTWIVFSSLLLYYKQIKQNTN